MKTAVAESTEACPKAELSAYLHPLIKACPVAKCNSAGCPLSGLRKMKSTQQAQWLNALNEDELAYLTHYYHVCISTS